MAQLYLKPMLENVWKHEVTLGLNVQKSKHMYFTTCNIYCGIIRFEIISHFDVKNIFLAQKLREIHQIFIKKSLEMGDFDFSLYGYLLGK